MPDLDELERQFVVEIAPLPSCPPLAILLAYGEGVLPEEGETEIGGHVAGCAVCQLLLKDMSSVEAPGWTGVERSRIRSRMVAGGVRFDNGLRRYGWMAVAACLLLAVGLAGRWMKHQTVEQQAAVPVAPMVSAPKTVDLEVAKLEPPVLQPQLVMRGAPSKEPGANDLAPAFALYEKNDYQGAAHRFALLAKEFPKSDIPMLYLGVSQLLDGDNAGALGSLAQADARAAHSRKDAASWYHAVAAVRMHSADAAPMLRTLCKRDASSYANQACAAAAELNASGQ